MDSAIKTIAYYLPQFHPIPENDKWWGKGFTEWTNVTKAKPLFRGHYQPQLPADLGFYDLRVPEVREEQAAMAKNHGIYGFCYWHYWFMGKRLLERPLNDVLASGKPDFPFCIAWANESWTRTWEGDEKDFLIKQEYSHEDDLAHARWIAEVFSDPRYIRIEGRPLLVIYRAPMLLDPQRTLDTFRSECTRLGLPEPYIIGRDTHNPGEDMRKFGCDITEISLPHLNYLYEKFTPLGINTLRKLKLGVFKQRIKVFDYKKSFEYINNNRPDHSHLVSFIISWDNTARRGKNAIILKDSSPEIVGKCFGTILKSVVDKPENEKIIFINAWNEWAEGMHLEPDQKWGYGFLEAIQREMSAYNANLLQP